MNKKIVKASLLLILWIIFLYPYLSGKYYTLIGFDAGFYVAEINRYLVPEINSLWSMISIWHEPIGILSAANYFQITGFSPHPDMKIWIGILLILKILSLYLSSRVIFRNQIQIFVFLLGLVLCNAFVNSFYLFIYRQFFSDFLLIVFLYFFCFKKIKNISLIIICSILWAGIYWSHRGVSLVFWFFLIWSILFTLFFKEWRKLWLIWLIISGILLLSMPYTIIWFKYNLRILSEFIQFTARSTQNIYATDSGLSIYTGWPLTDKSETWKIFLLDPILWLFAIVFLCKIKKITKKKFIWLWIFSMLYFFVDLQWPFSQRLLYYLIIVYFIICSLNVQKSFLTILILFLTIITGWVFIFWQHPRIKYTPETYDFFKNFDKDKTIFIANGSQGVLVDELWWRTTSAEAFWQVRYTGDLRDYASPNYDKIYAIWYTWPLEIYNESFANYYVIIPFWLDGKSNEYGLIDINKWNNSLYFERVNSPCTSMNRYFCYIYKYIWPFQKKKNMTE